MTYDTTFWGVSSNSNKTFVLQKKGIRTVADAQKGNQCRKLFKKFHILHLALTTAATDNLEMFQTNHRPVTNLRPSKRSLLCRDKITV
jgi:hypothetical protein